jgi:lipopolysaccharide/colanic/teichoic acid biosynthesis glycosyltransferase
MGLVDDDPKFLGKTVLGYTVIGRIRDIPRILRDHVVDRVIFVVPRLWLNRIEDALLHCEREGVSTGITVDLFKLKLGKLEISTFANIPLLVSQTSGAKEWQLFLKRISDVAVSLFLIVLLSPVFIFAAIAVRLDSKGPVFFRQVRSGRNGRKFTLIKFRSMHQGAEMRKREIEKQNEMNGPVFKIRRDPRVTRFGRFMRKLSIDELPQFFNVLKADMSLVGPRPPLPAEVEMYETWHRRRLSMKPGITCIWQVRAATRSISTGGWKWTCSTSTIFPCGLISRFWSGPFSWWSPDTERPDRSFDFAQDGLLDSARGAVLRLRSGLRFSRSFIILARFASSF